ncbi:MAG: tetratricopeptide repeat protein [Candidatus Eisenbacteria bacterium]
MLLALAVVAACVLIGATFVSSDTDFWQHLVVGKAMWSEHRIPMTNEWTWPTYGERQVLPSWLFRAALWPFWKLGELNGLQIWRWLTTIVAFTFLWLAARRLGARGFAAIAMIAWCGLVYRHRIYVRPETIAAVLTALTLWILLARRGGGPDRSWWLVPIAWIWANAHISYWMLFALLGVHVFADFFDRTKRRPPLAWVGLAAMAACFLHPFGWKALAEPFLYATVWRNDPAFRTIGELQPVDWKFLATTGYMALLPLWPLLTALRARRHGWDMAELLTCALFSVLGLWNQRFVAVWALVAAPYLARGAAALAAEIRWPALLRPVWSRALLLAIVCIGGSLAEWRRTDLAFGSSVAASSYPAGACDFMAQHGVRGRGFNHFELGGYMLWRFWPERERLPFLDVHLTGAPEDRRLAGFMLNQPAAWRALDNRHRFPFAMLRRLHGAGDVSLDILEADSNFTLVFLDDAAALYLRREGPYATLADSLAFRIVRAGRAGMGAMGRALTADSSLRPVLRAELDRMRTSSPANSGAHSILAQLDLLERRWSGARAHLDSARVVDPLVPGFHERMGLAWLREGRIAEATLELELAAKRDRSVAAWALLGEAHARAGDRAAARRAFQRALEKDPGNALARRGLEGLGTP